MPVLTALCVSGCAGTSINLYLWEQHYYMGTTWGLLGGWHHSESQGECKSFTCNFNLWFLIWFFFLFCLFPYQILIYFPWHFPMLFSSLSVSPLLSFPVGILWNLSSKDNLKERLSRDTLPELTENILIPLSGTGEQDTIELSASESDIFNNTTGCLRYTHVSCTHAHTFLSSPLLLPVPIGTSSTSVNENPL